MIHATAPVWPLNTTLFPGMYFVVLEVYLVMQRSEKKGEYEQHFVEITVLLNIWFIPILSMVSILLLV